MRYYRMCYSEVFASIVISLVIRSIVLLDSTHYSLKLLLQYVLIHYCK